MSQEQQTENLTEEERKKLKKKMDEINQVLNNLSEEDFKKSNVEIASRKLKIKELEDNLFIQNAALKRTHKELAAARVNKQDTNIFEERLKTQQSGVDKTTEEIIKLKELNSKEPAVLGEEINQIYDKLNPPNPNSLKISPSKTSQKEIKRLIQDLRQPEILTGIQESLTKDDYFIKQALKSENDNKWIFSSKDNKEEFELTNNFARTSHCSEKNLTTMVNVLAKGLDENIKELEVSGNTPETREKTEKLLAKALLENNKKDVIVNGKSIADILSPKTPQQSNPPKPPPLPPPLSSGPSMR